MTLATSAFTQSLLDLEDEGPDVLSEPLPGSSVPFWPQVRMSLAYAMSANELTSVVVDAPAARFGRLRRVARAVLPAHDDIRSLKDPRDLLFVVGGTTTHPTPRGIRNWLVDDFAEAAADRAAVVQWRPLRGPTSFRPTRTLDAVHARAEVRNRLRPRPVDDAVRRLVEEFARRLASGLTAEQIDAVVAEAAYTFPLRAHMNREIGELLDRLRPRVVLFEDAVDGGWGATVAEMKAHGIRVVEPQHGWIGPAHAAYNFGAAMRRPELAATLPDELLTFGSYWGSGLRYLPGRVTPIGKPHLERQVALARPLDERPPTVLVVSSVGEPERTSAFVRRLAADLPAGWSVRFRPHPSERDAMAERYPALLGAPGVEIDEVADVYESLATSRIVLGVASTVLFEAVAMGCRVFVRDTAYVPVIVGDLFGAPVRDDDLARVVHACEHPDAPASSLAVAPEELWQPDAVATFRRWADERLAASP